MTEWHHNQAPRDAHGHPIEYDSKEVFYIEMIEKLREQERAAAKEEGWEAYVDLTERLEVAFFKTLEASDVFGPGVEVQINPDTKYGDYHDHIDGIVFLDIPETDQVSRRVALAVDFTISSSQSTLAEKLHRTITEPFVSTTHGTPKVSLGTHCIRALIALDENRIKRLADHYYLEKAAAKLDQPKLSVLEHSRQAASQFADDKLFKEQIISALRIQLEEQVAELTTRGVPEKMLTEHQLLLTHFNKLTTENKSRGDVSAGESASDLGAAALVADVDFVRQARVGRLNPVGSYSAQPDGRSAA
jgi:hypothetical protein